MRLELWSYSGLKFYVGKNCVWWRDNACIKCYLNSQCLWSVLKSFLDCLTSNFPFIASAPSLTFALILSLCHNRTLRCSDLGLYGTPGTSCAHKEPKYSHWKDLSFKCTANKRCHILPVLLRSEAFNLFINGEPRELQSGFLPLCPNCS